MLDSIYKDIKRQVQMGNTVTRIIIVNIAVFVILNLVYVFDYHAHSGVATDSFYNTFRSFLILPSDPMTFLKRFWTIITHMFTHKGFWHLGWNMLIFYWFARILGDFIGDKKVLPLYLMAGVAGAMVFILTDLLIPTGTGGQAVALGASGAVVGILVAAATLSPDYTMNLILLGPVKIKWIAMVSVFFYIIGTAGSGNEGGNWAHLGGAAFGYLYITQLRRGQDLTGWLQRLIYREDRGANQSKRPVSQPKRTKPRKSALSIVHKKEEQEAPGAAMDNQAKLDNILDKIKESGYDNLSQEEKDYLHLMSKS